MEPDRINALKRYEILDTPAEGNVDRTTLLASKVFNVPIAIISLVDEDRIWFKSSQGLSDIHERDNSPGLCASAILSDDIYLIEDAKNDPRSKRYINSEQQALLRQLAEIVMRETELRLAARNRIRVYEQRIATLEAQIIAYAQAENARAPAQRPSAAVILPRNFSDGS